MRSTVKTDRHERLRSALMLIIPQLNLSKSSTYSYTVVHFRGINPANIHHLSLRRRHKTEYSLTIFEDRPHFDGASGE